MTQRTYHSDQAFEARGQATRDQFPDPGMVQAQQLDPKERAPGVARAQLNAALKEAGLALSRLEALEALVMEVTGRGPENEACPPDAEPRAYEPSSINGQAEELQSRIGQIKARIVVVTDLVREYL